MPQCRFKDHFASFSCLIFEDRDRGTYPPSKMGLRTSFCGIQQQAAVHGWRGSCGGGGRCESQKSQLREPVDVQPVFGASVESTDTVSEAEDISS